METEQYKTDVEVNICAKVRNTLLLSLLVYKELGYVPQDFPSVIPPSRGWSLHCETGSRAPVTILSNQQKKSWKVGEPATEAELKKIRERLIEPYPDVFYNGEELPSMSGGEMHIELEE